ncbi:CHRD domain-containing protein [Aquincola tertiaricarbonis]|uniref:CHRD domain-containing protein n=1 Tax=Aquincola tertiaricarbonis TaxID=391953 RepID=A0ABY4SH39_AQUTE|nr:CHRD domain-containing protein [Aquincola tertiaricarbonis]URI11475.1 CHRD domain-containing protein [Aquincola tertiaricarbonis]
MIKKSVLCAAILIAPFMATPALASIDTYTAFLYGSNETGGGDTDGFGVATVLIDNAALTVSWSIMANNIELPLTGAHIHAAAAGVNGPVIVDFSGSLTGSRLYDADLASITPMNPTSFYVNLHNASFPAGAIRGQLQYVGTAMAPVPEPETYALMLGGLGAIGLLVRRRQAARG